MNYNHNRLVVRRSQSTTDIQTILIGPKNRLKRIPDYDAWGNPGSTDGIRYKALLELDHNPQETISRLTCSIQLSLNFWNTC